MTDVVIAPTLAHLGQTYIVEQIYSINYSNGDLAGKWTFKRPFTIVDECGDANLSSIATFPVSDMTTSVLRPVSETSRDLNWYFPSENSPTLHSADSLKYINTICGNIMVDIVHDGVTAEFLSITYDYLVLVDPQTYFLQLNPTLRTHEGTFNVDLRVYF